MLVPEVSATEQGIMDKGGLSFTFDLKLGIKLGIKLMPNPALNRGVAVKAASIEGLAGAAGAVSGDIIAFLNGVDVRLLDSLQTVPGILGKDMLRMTLEARAGAFQMFAQSHNACLSDACFPSYILSVLFLFEPSETNNTRFAPSPPPPCAGLTVSQACSSF
jgi:hypothetical protein